VNILWMTLCTCLVILMSMDWGLQSMSRDYQRFKVIERYHQERLKQNFACQKQYYGQLKRSWSGLGQAPPSQVKSELMPVQELDEAQLDAGEKETPLYRFSNYPLHARFPLSVKLFQSEDVKGSHWKESWWSLLDTLYASEDFYSTWRSQVDPESFIKELVEGIDKLSQGWSGAGSWGLLHLSFEHLQDQRVWYQMLKGSDRMGSCFPSLLVYVWAVDLTPKSDHFPSRLNLPTASLEIIAALLGETFAQEWKKNVEEEVSNRIEQIGYKGNTSGPWLLDAKTYKDLLEKIKNLAEVSPDQINQFADTSAGGWPLTHEYLIKGLGRSGYLASTLQMRSKPK
jgi:hypothetical protein